MINFKLILKVASFVILGISHPTFAFVISDYGVDPRAEARRQARLQAARARGATYRKSTTKPVSRTTSTTARRKKAVKKPTAQARRKVARQSSPASKPKRTETRESKPVATSPAPSPTPAEVAESKPFEAPKSVEPSTESTAAATPATTPPAPLTKAETQSAQPEDPTDKNKVGAKEFGQQTAKHSCEAQPGFERNGRGQAIPVNPKDIQSKMDSFFAKDFLTANRTPKSARFVQEDFEGERPGEMLRLARGESGRYELGYKSNNIKPTSTVIEKLCVADDNLLLFTKDPDGKTVAIQFKKAGEGKFAVKSRSYQNETAQWSPTTEIKAKLLNPKEIQRPVESIEMSEAQIAR